MADSSTNSVSAREFGEFVIDSLTPETVPMGRLAEYVSTLADLLGNRDDVHFDRVEEGSLKIKYWTREESAREILERPLAASEGTAEKAAMSAFERLNDLLEDDSAIGKLAFSGAVVAFPGRERAHLPSYGPIDDEMEVEGQLVRIGGRDKTVPALIKDGDNFYNCNMTRGLAMDMCHYLFGPVIRVAGKAKWRRNRDGKWELTEFFAHRFAELDDIGLRELVENLRTIEDNDWRKLPDPLAEAAELRGGD